MDEEFILREEIARLKNRVRKLENKSKVANEAAVYYRDIAYNNYLVARLVRSTTKVQPISPYGRMGSGSFKNDKKTRRAKEVGQ